MFDNFLVRKDSLQNVVENGTLAGFRFAVRIADYRGCFLSLHNGYFIQLDGVSYPTELQRFEINGRPPRSFEEIKKRVWEHWNYDDEGFVYVDKPGGLTHGKHTLALQQSVLSQYGYFPHDEEWVQNPPVPGLGEGAGKTDTICTFDLELNETEG